MLGMGPSALPMRGQHCQSHVPGISPPPPPFLSKLISLEGKRRKGLLSAKWKREEEEEEEQGKPLRPRGHPLGLAGGSEGGETHRKLGQHIGSGSHSNANHVLEPVVEQGWSLYGCDVISHETQLEHILPTTPSPQPKSVSAMGTSYPTAQSQRLGGTYPKCCTTLGSMAASCSMEGNWYL